MSILKRFHTEENVFAETVLTNAAGSAGLMRLVVPGFNCSGDCRGAQVLVDIVRREIMRDPEPAVQIDRPPID